MLNINDLEARHKKYKLRQYLPYAFISIFFIILSIVFFNYTNNDKKIEYKDNYNEIEKKSKIFTKEITQTIENNKTKDTNITLDVKKEKVIIKVIKPKDTKVIKNVRTTLSPSLDFMKELQPNDVHHYETQQTKYKDTVPEEIRANKQVVTTTEEVVVVEEVPEITIKKKSAIKIKRNDANDEIAHVIKRFKVNNNPALSLFIAKKYYQSAEYRKSYNYALITNQINNNIEASWIIFAKSLMKLGEKEMAIKTLKKYIDHSHSSQAKILLDEINSGKFK